MIILAAQVPNQPSAPDTTVDGDFVVFSWDKPNEQGSPIVEYRLLIKKSDGAFAMDLTHCDGTNDVVVFTRTCSVPIDTLRNSPFNLVWGDSIVAKVTAINAYGSSLSSIEGNGAIIVTVPDSPLSLEENI